MTLPGRFGRLFLIVLTVLLAACSDGGDLPMPTLPAIPDRPPPIAPEALVDPVWEVVLAVGDEPLGTGETTALALAERWGEAGLPIERIHRLSPGQTETATRPGSSGGKGGGRGGGRTGHRSGEPDTAPEPSGTESKTDDPDLPSVVPEKHARTRPGDLEAATEARILRQIATLGGGRRDACFVYLAGTGDGRAIKLRDGKIEEDLLDRALAARCGAAPTVLVASGCATGFLAAGPIARPNRLILTAPDNGASGFGCGPNLGLTTFEECLLGSLDGAARWREIAGSTRLCVLTRTRLAGQPPVAPGIALGAAVADLPAPWNKAGRALDFRRGIGRLTIDDAPYYPALKRRTRAAFESYLAAPEPKAMALTLAGTVVVVAGTGVETPDDVARLAVERCEYRSAGACILYAEGSAVSAANNSGSPHIQRRQLVLHGTVDPAMVPFIRNDERSAVADYLRRPGSKALALAPDGERLAVGTGINQASADADALKTCKAGLPVGGACVLYAEGDRIVLAAE